MITTEVTMIEQAIPIIKRILENKPYSKYIDVLISANVTDIESVISSVSVVGDEFGQIQQMAQRFKREAKKRQEEELATKERLRFIGAFDAFVVNGAPYKWHQDEKGKIVRRWSPDAYRKYMVTSDESGRPIRYVYQLSDGRKNISGWRDTHHQA